MDRNENAAKSIRKQTTICLATAISTALQDEYGDDWFEIIKEEDMASEYPILGKATRFGDCDFQAMVKLLKYRPKYKEIILTYYQTPIAGIEKKANARMSDFDSLLTRLINYRNDLDAHESLEDVERQVKGENLRKIYGYTEAISDMIKLTEVFEEIEDEQGVSYHDRVLRIQSDLQKESASQAYSISKMLARERLNADVGEIVKICQDLRIEVRTVAYELCFVTSDYERTVLHIKKMAEASQKVNQVQAVRPQSPAAPVSEKRKSKKPLVILAVGASLALVVGIGLLAVLAKNALARKAEAVRSGSTPEPVVAAAPIQEDEAQNNVQLPVNAVQRTADSAPATKAAVLTQAPTAVSPAPELAEAPMVIPETPVPTDAPTAAPETPAPTDTPAPTEAPVREVAVLKNAKTSGMSLSKKTTIEYSDGTVFTSDNMYSLSGEDPQDYTAINLGGEYSRLTGGIKLFDILFGKATVVFQIFGDGEKLAEYRFPEIGESTNWDYIPIDISLLGVKQLRLRFFSSNDDGKTDQYSYIRLIDWIATTATAEELASVPEKPEKEKDNRVDLFDLKLSGKYSLDRTAASNGSKIWDSGNTYWLNSDKKLENGIRITLAKKHQRLTGIACPQGYETFAYGDNTLIFRISGDGEVLYEHVYPKGETITKEELDIDVDVSEVEELKIQLIQLEDNGSYSGKQLRLGLIDFKLTPKE